MSDFFLSVTFPTHFKLLLSPFYAKILQTPKKEREKIMPARMSFHSLSAKSSLCKLDRSLYANNGLNSLLGYTYQLRNRQNLPWKSDCMQQL